MTNPKRGIKSWLLTSCVLVAVVLVGVLPAQAGKYAEKVKTQERATADADSALVYFYRGTVAGAAIYFWTFADEELVGLSRGKCYFYAKLPPGKTLLWAKAENVAAMELELEAGKTYYLRQKVIPGFGKARVRMELVPEDEALKSLDRIKKMTQPTDEGRAKAPEIVERLLAKAKEKAAGGGEETEE